MKGVENDHSLRDKQLPTLQSECGLALRQGCAFWGDRACRARLQGSRGPQVEDLLLLLCMYYSIYLPKMPYGTPVQALCCQVPRVP